MYVCLCVSFFREDRQCIRPESNQLCEELLTTPLDLDSSLGPQKQHFHTAYSTQALFQPLQTVFTVEVSQHARRGSAAHHF